MNDEAPDFLRKRAAKPQANAPEDDDSDADVEFAKHLGASPCVSRPSPKPFYGLRILRPGKPDQIVEYYGVDGEGENDKVKFITGGHRVWEIVVEGRNLKRLLGYLKEHRIDWIRQADRDTYHDKELYISRILAARIPHDKV